MPPAAVPGHESRPARCHVGHGAGRVAAVRAGLVAVVIAAAALVASAGDGGGASLPTGTRGAQPQVAPQAGPTTTPAAPQAGLRVDRLAGDAGPAGAAGRSGRGLSVQQIGRRALASLDYPWQRLGYEVVFAPRRRGLLGYTDAGARTITVYVRPGQAPLELRTTIAHELGHALDFAYGSPERRADYRRFRGLSTSSNWFPCYGCQDYASPAGDYAEVFAYWLAGPGDFRSRLAGPPSRAQLTRLVPIFQIPDTTSEAGGSSTGPGRAGPSPKPSPSPTSDPSDPQTVVEQLVSPSPRP